MPMWLVVLSAAEAAQSPGSLEVQGTVLQHFYPEGIFNSCSTLPMKEL